MEQRAQILMLAMTFWLANNIKNLPTISKICQQYQEPAANNIKNLPTISRTSSQQCQKPATKLMVAYQSIVLNLSL